MTYVPYILVNGQLVPNVTPCPPTSCVPVPSAASAADFVYYPFSPGYAGLVPAPTATQAANGALLNAAGQWVSAPVVPAAAGTLTGTTLATNVTSSSLVSFGANPTLLAPTITGGAWNASTQLGLRDTSASFDLRLAASSSLPLTAIRTLTFDIANASATLKLTGSPTLADWFDQSVKTIATPRFAGLALRDTSAAFNVTLGATSSTALTANRAITLDVVNASQTIKLLGSPTLADWFDQSVKVAGNPQFASLSLRDTSATFNVTLGATSSTTLTANRAITLDVVNASQTIKLLGSPTLSNWFDQSVKVAATPQFSRIGVGTPATTSSDLIVSHSVPPSSAQASVVVTGTLSAPPATDLHPNAFRDLTVFVPTSPADGYCSYDAQTQMGGAVALNHYRGYQVRTAFTGTNTLGELSGYMTSNMGLNGAGTVSFMRSFYVSQPTITGGGVVGQFDGIYMDALTNPTGLVNAIYIAGANRVFMAGGQLVTSVDLTPPAGATTARGAFTFDQGSQTGLAVMNRNATATGTMISFCRDGGGVQGSVTQTNNTTVAYNTSSDARLKENFRDISSADSGRIVDEVRPRLYDWKNGSKDVYGFVAQELHPVYPQAVRVGGDDMMTSPWMLEKSALIPVMFAELKYLRQRVAQLEAAR